MRRDNPGADKHLNQYYPVHNAGFVALVDYMGDDTAVEEMARVSYGKGTRSVSDTRHLLRYLVRHRHTSPLEGAELKFHMAMPIFVARQFIRHRTANVNEYSGRYSEMPQVAFTPSEWRKQSESNKQGSSDEALQEDATRSLDYLEWDALKTSQDFYQKALYMGTAKELARIHLPLSMYTQWYWKMDLHNLLHFLSLRTDSHAQEEIRDYANVMAAIVADAFPVLFEAWVDYRAEAHTFSRHEFGLLHKLLAGTVSIGEACTTEGMVMNHAPELSRREAQEFLNKIHDPRYFGGVPEVIFDLPTPITPEQAQERLFP